MVDVLRLQSLLQIKRYCHLNGSEIHAVRRLTTQPFHLNRTSQVLMQTHDKSQLLFQMRSNNTMASAYEPSWVWVCYYWSWPSRDEVLSRNSSGLESDIFQEPWYTSVPRTFFILFLIEQRSAMKCLTNLVLASCKKLCRKQHLSIAP